MRRPPFFPRPFAALAPLTLSLFAAVVSLAPPLAAQQPAKGLNLFGDTAGFERSTLQDNLWDGVNGDGSLAGFTYSANVVTERGSFGGLAMPPSVAFIDLNGDGKPDLLTADPLGYFRFYANVGTKTEPKFTNAEIVPIYLPLVNKQRDYSNKRSGDIEDARFCPRFALADWRRTGLLDLMIGDYLGEMFFIPNTGNPRQPQYRMLGYERMRVRTHDQDRFWANLLSPVAYNWTGGNKPDLIVGEGTYSANSIHLLENIGTGDVPKFSSARDKHTYLAYGDGREQLIPCVVDYDGDGKPDLLIADRTGEIGVYLNTGKRGEELKRSSTITFGGTAKLPGLCSIYAADYNGDGLFDLILGLPNGHIAVSLNTGTKTEPQFGPLQDIKGEDRLKREVHTPDGWNTETYNALGNALTCVNVVDGSIDPEAVKPPEGTHCLKFGYWPTVQPTFPLAATGIPDATLHITLLRGGLSLTAGKRYHFSFKAKGSGTEKLHWEFKARFSGAPTKIERDERGGVKSGSMVEEYIDIGQDFSVGNNWATVQGDFTPRYKNPALAGEKTIQMGLHLEFYATTLAGVLYLDDFGLTEAQ